MSGQELLTVGEFERSMRTLERTILHGFNQQETRMMRIEKALADHGERLAAVETSDDEHERRLEGLEAADKARTRKVAAVGSVIAGALVGVIEAFKAWWR